MRLIIFIWLLLLLNFSMEAVDFFSNPTDIAILNRVDAPPQDGSLSNMLVAYWEFDEAGSPRVDIWASYQMITGGDCDPSAGTKIAGCLSIGNSGDPDFFDCFILGTAQVPGDALTNGWTVAYMATIYDDYYTGNDQLGLWLDCGAVDYVKHILRAADDSSASLEIATGGAPEVTSYGSTEANGTWKNYAITKSTNGLFIYVNGAFVYSNASALAKAPLLSNANNTVYPALTSSAQIDEFLIWKRVLTDTEIYKLYTNNAANRSNKWMLQIP